MTFLTKPSITVKKPDSPEVTKSALVGKTNYEDNNLCGGSCEEEKIDMQPEYVISKRTWDVSGVLCMCLSAALIVVMLLSCGLVLYRQLVHGGAGLVSYQGFCAIPLERRILQSQFPKPLFWSAQGPELGDNAAAPPLPPLPPGAPVLSERVDIDGAAETISVYDESRDVNYFHDFANNITGIIEPERCFLMDLDPETVLRPDVFVLSIERGDDFDLSRVRVSLHAALPALHELLQPPALLRRCQPRPVYRLQGPDADSGSDADSAPIRKRSADPAPAPARADFVQFAGRHVQEIDVANLRDVLAYESAHRAPRTAPRTDPQ